MSRDVVQLESDLREAITQLRVENAKLVRVVEQANLRAATAERRNDALRKALTEFVGRQRVNQIEREAVR